MQYYNGKVAVSATEFQRMYARFKREKKNVNTALFDYQEQSIFEIDWLCRALEHWRLNPGSQFSNYIFDFRARYEVFVSFKFQNGPQIYFIFKDDYADRDLL